MSLRGVEDLVLCVRGVSVSSPVATTSLKEAFGAKATTHEDGQHSHDLKHPLQLLPILPLRALDPLLLRIFDQDSIRSEQSKRRDRALVDGVEEVGRRAGFGERCVRADGGCCEGSGASARECESCLADEHGCEREEGEREEQTRFLRGGEEVRRQTGGIRCT